MTKEHWNDIVEHRVSGMLGDDPLPHTVCNWTVCTLPLGHDGDCERIPLETAGPACGEIAFKMGFGPCPFCPALYEQ